MGPQVSFWSNWPKTNLGSDLYALTWFTCINQRLQMTHPTVLGWPVLLPLALWQHSFPDSEQYGANSLHGDCSLLTILDHTLDADFSLTTALRYLSFPPLLQTIPSQVLIMCLQFCKQPMVLRLLRYWSRSLMAIGLSFFSHHVSPAEQHYSTFDKELLQHTLLCSYFNLLWRPWEAYSLQSEPHKLK